MDIKTASQKAQDIFAQIDDLECLYVKDKISTSIADIKNNYKKLCASYNEAIRVALSIFATSRAKNGLAFRGIMYKKLLLSKNSLYPAYERYKSNSNLKSDVASVADNLMSNILQKIFNKFTDEKDIFKYTIDMPSSELHRSIDDLIIKTGNLLKNSSEHLVIDKEFSLFAKEVIRTDSGDRPAYTSLNCGTGKYIFDISGQITHESDNRHSYYYMRRDPDPSILLLYDEGKAVKNKLISNMINIQDEIESNLQTYKTEFAHKLVLLGL